MIPIPKIPKKRGPRGPTIPLYLMEGVRLAIEMRINYIETGTVYMSKEDGVEHNKRVPAKPKPYSLMVKHKRPVEIRSLSDSQLKLISDLKKARDRLVKQKANNEIR
jgi:hypothetical protein